MESAGAGGNHPGEMVMIKRPAANPFVDLRDRMKSFETGLRAWVARQPVHVEAAYATAVGAVQGAALGGLLSTLSSGDGVQLTPTPTPPPGLNPQAMASFQQAQALAVGPLAQARNFAVMSGANAGISCVMRRIRGKDDVEGSMAAAFGSGALFSLVSGMGTPNPAVSAITTGAAFAIFQGGFFMLGQKFFQSSPQSDDAYYSRTKSMLRNLGLQNYEKNFKKGLLTDNTLPLLTDSALRDVRIPPGPRLIILDHIRRDPEVMKGL